MRFAVRVGDEDNYGTFIGRLQEKLFQKGKTAIKSGESITGEGWELNRNSLVIKKGQRQDETISISEISAAGIWDNNLCIWRRGEEKTIFQSLAYNEEFQPSCSPAK